MSDGGKGSKSRPFCVSNEEYAKSWDMIFGTDQEKNDKLFEGELAFDNNQQLLNENIGNETKTPPQ